MLQDTNIIALESSGETGEVNKPGYSQYITWDNVAKNKNLESTQYLLCCNYCTHLPKYNPVLEYIHSKCIL